jgi:glycine/D-amino acid oxidase-like deaminating enzyme
VAAQPSVAVLGGGIMGSSVALHLARLGARATVFEREEAPFRGASRWNEGKIHLGFLYAADPSLGTARSVLDGGLDFASQVERLTGASCAERMTRADDTYLVHRGSVAPPDAAREYFERLAALVRDNPRAGDYLVDVSDCRVRELDPGELEAVADPDAVAAGLRVPERSVDTNFVADAFVNALGDTPAVEVACGVAVNAVEREGERWMVRAGDEAHGPYDAVVNALWEGRPAVDRTVGHRPDEGEQHRYRVSLFVRTETPLDVSSAVVAVGPYGDVKDYGNRDFYVSWYPAGLLARSESVDPPPVPVLDDAAHERIAAETFAGLGALVPGVLEIERKATEVRVEGGWVYSQGRGLLDDPGASIHRRDRHGISRLDSYFSVDTGKYSVAPTLAEELAQLVLERRPKG